MLKELTKQLRALRNLNLKQVSIRDDVVAVLTRKGKIHEIDIKGLKKKDAIEKVVNFFKAVKKVVKKSKK